MSMWTSDQNLAINTRGGKVIVSAAAGSGKTAVLSERVTQYILNGGNISDLLIVTFTKAAALEMKDRIKAKIEKQYLENKSEHLKNQISLIEVAKITTIDAFYSDIVKNNFEKLGIEKDFNMLNKLEEDILSNDVINDTLNLAFDEVDGFYDMLNMFCDTDINVIKDIILKISSFLDSTAYPNKFIEKSINNYSSGNLYKKLVINNVVKKINSIKTLYEEIKEELYNESSDFDVLIEGIDKEINYLNNFCVIDSFDSLSFNIRRIEFDRLKTPKGHKNDQVMIKYKIIREEFKNYIKKDIKELAFLNDELYKKENEKCLKTVNTLFKLVLMYRDELIKRKKLINSYTFSDISSFVIKLLLIDGKKTELAKKISNNYVEILIDEYQDTNSMQNVIFNAISDDGNKLFIVGDVKQSIYRFRSACPSIFNDDKNTAFKDKFPRLITLSKNFRSRKEVLSFCNFIFSNTMTEYFGEVNYDDSEKLYLGASFDEGDNLDTEVHIIDGKEKIEDETDELTKAEKEAIYVAEMIKKLLDNNYQVYDNKKGIRRSIKESDIVILLRSLKNANLYTKALNKRGISVYSESAPLYFDNYEVKLIINILKLIDNPYDDVALTSLLLSPLCKVSLNDLALVKLDDKASLLYENIINSDNTYIKDIISKIDDIRLKSYNNAIYETLNLIYKEFDCIKILSSKEGGIKKEKNIIQMLNHAYSFEKDGTKSLHEFINYIENIINNKSSLDGVNPLKEGDNVLITTIHKSKGLEYPVVFLSETGKSFNFMDLRSELMINDDLGISFNIRNDEYKVKYESVPQMVFKNYEKEKMLSEELRILYVALTRAKEKIIITGYSSNLENLCIKASSKIGDNNVISDLYLSSVKSYLDIIVACLLRHRDCKELREYSSVLPKVFDSDSNVIFNSLSANLINEKEFDEKEEIIKEKLDIELLNKVFNFEYKNSNSMIPSYLSVSDIKQSKQFIKVPSFITNKSSTKIGTLYHKIFELLPVKKYNMTELNYELNNLISNDYISIYDISNVDKNKILEYLLSPLYSDLINSDKYYKEYEITFNIPSNIYDNSLKDGIILTSGIIDLLFIKDDTYYIVDYKTDDINNIDELIKRYKIQLDLYEIGIRNIMNAKNVIKIIYSVKLNRYIKVE